MRYQIPLQLSTRNKLKETIFTIKYTNKEGSENIPLTFIISMKSPTYNIISKKEKEKKKMIDHEGDIVKLFPFTCISQSLSPQLYIRQC
jgi:hypothetical protein